VSQEGDMIALMALLLVGTLVFNFLDAIITAIKWIFITALIGGGSTVLYLHYVKGIRIETILEEILE